MDYKPRSGGFMGKVPLVNGTLDPTLSVSPAVYRFRILNGCNARIFRFAFADGTPFLLIGNDGGFLPDQPVTLAEMLLSPAERVDVLVDLTGREGDTLMLMDMDSGWDLLELTVDGTGSGNGVIPSGLPAVAALSGPATPTREFSFDGMSKINGQLYDMARVDFSVPRDVVERWRFTTNGNAPHPVHIHGAYFQVVDRSGGRGEIYPWEMGWKDSVLLEDGETVDVLIKFDSGYTGLYLMHCHKLEHEDMGMMTNFEVI
jgi:FtsP/CotA-like multicopper oxidase with cupredoxin domain